MTAQTVHVVVAFTEGDDGIFAEQPVAMQSAGAARSRALALSNSGKHVGVIAWSRSIDPQTGDAGDPEVIVRLGTIPEWFDESGDAGG